METIGRVILPVLLCVAALATFIVLAVGVRVLAPPGELSTAGRTPQAVKVRLIRVSTVERLETVLDQAGYSLTAVRSGEAHVPALLLAALPRNLRTTVPVSRRKSLFLRVMLPLVLFCNDIILERRRGLEQLEPDGAEPEVRAWAEALARRYRLPDDAYREGTSREELLRRIDLVPASLALAQAALESGWGTSRFSFQGNALFGVRTWHVDAGLRPAELDPGQNYAVRRYRMLSDSVCSYMHNLNVSAYYAGFRAERARLRHSGAERGRWGYELADTLDTYSEGGSRYTAIVRNVIESNRLDDFDTAALSYRTTLLPEG